MRKLALLLIVVASASALFLVVDVRALTGQVEQWAQQAAEWIQPRTATVVPQLAGWAQSRMTAVAPKVAEWIAALGSQPYAPTDGDSFDYNCALPGKGYPWLMRMMATGVDGESRCVPWFYMSWLGGPDFHVPVPIQEEDWCPVDMRDVYRRLCQVHPELGGGGLSPLPEKGLYWFTDGGDGFPHWYRLPPIPDRIFEDALAEARQETTPAKPEPQRRVEETPAEKQQWHVTITGYEIDEMDPYWQLTTRVRGAVRFDYSLRGQFVLRKKEQAWVFESGSITFASVGLTSLYEPDRTWEVKPLQCRGCDKVSSASQLGGQVFGDDVMLRWGTFRPSVDVEARIVISCQPMPSCARWGERTYVSETFFDRISGELLPLQDGFTKTYTVTNPQGSTWVSFTYTLTREPQ